MNRTFMGEVTFLTEEQGGRRNNVYSKYRPHLVFDNDTDEYKTSAQHIFIDKDWLSLGEKGKVNITLLSGDYEYTIRETFKTYEGHRQVGYGRVIEDISGHFSP